MNKQLPQFETRLARSSDDIKAAQRLRYDVFVTELGAQTDGTDHDQCIEADEFDPYFDHLLLIDKARGGRVAGVYRLLHSMMLGKSGGFYSADEYDLDVLVSSKRKLLELGRSCLHADYRGGTGLIHLWQGLAAYVQAHEIEVLFGVASFHGTNPKDLAQALSFLHHNHLAPHELRVRSTQDPFQTLDLLPADMVDRKMAIQQIPALIKAYLRLGGCVGDGAFIDYGFNTTDVCLIIDTNRMNEKQSQRYSKGQG